MMKRTAFVLLALSAIQLVLSIDLSCVTNQNVRQFNGSCNNLDHSLWAAANVPEKRLGAPRYQDGQTVPVDGPNARAISQRIFALPTQVPDINKTFVQREFAPGPRPELRGLNMFSILTLQFLTHDMAFTPLIFDPDRPQDNFGVLIENCNPGTSRKFDELCIWPAPNDPNALPFPQAALFTRLSDFELVGGVFTPRTTVSGFIDLHTVYGSSDEVANKLRSFSNGKMKVGNNNEPLPRAEDVGVENDCGPFVTDGFGAGDIRVDENTGIITLHIAFLRYHNYLCDQLIAAGVTGDQNIFNRARDLNIATWQHIVYDELLPAIFGSTFVNQYIGAYTGYNPTTDPSITVESQTAGFRFHNMLNLPLLHATPTCEFLSGDLEFFANIPQSTEEHFNCQPQRFRDIGVEPVLRGLTIQHAHFFDETVTDALRNLRLGAPGNVDVASADIFRSRLHGMPDYNSLRQLVGLDSVYAHCTASNNANPDPIQCFDFITPNHTLALALQSIYGKVSAMDSVVGIHAEEVPSHSSVTRSAAAVELKQLKALRDGDRFFWKNHLSAADQVSISSKTMKSVIDVVFPTIAPEISATPFFVNKNHKCARDSCDVEAVTKGVVADYIVSAVVADSWGSSAADRQYRVAVTMTFPTGSNGWRVGVILPSSSDKIANQWSVYNAANYACSNSNTNAFTVKPAGLWSQVVAPGGTIEWEYVATNPTNVLPQNIIANTRFTSFAV